MEKRVTPQSLIQQGTLPVPAENTALNGTQRSLDWVLTRSLQGAHSL